MIEIQQHWNKQNTLEFNMNYQCNRKYHSLCFQDVGFSDRCNSWLQSTMSNRVPGDIASLQYSNVVTHHTRTWVFGYVFYEIDNRRKVNRTSVTT